MICASQYLSHSSTNSIINYWISKRVHFYIQVMIECPTTLNMFHTHNYYTYNIFTVEPPYDHLQRATTRYKTAKKSGPD